MKICTKCKEEKNKSEFYNNKAMKDGLQSYCKKCNTENSTQWFINNREKHYDSVNRFQKNNPVRVREIQQKTTAKSKQEDPEKWKKRAKRNSIKWRKNNPEKLKANYLLNYAVKSGKIKRLPCIKCGDPKSHGHHSDYSKPYDVVWLCAKHHGKITSSNH